MDSLVNDENAFESKLNTLLTYTLWGDREDEEVFGERKPSNWSEPITKNLGMISSLYIYTNVPPHAYGTQAPKVAETVRRAYSFNLKEKRKTIEILGFPTERMHWEKEDKAFPFGQVHGNFLPCEAYKMVCSFLKLNHAEIDSAVERIMHEIAGQNSDILTSGRQTFCPFQEKSLTAASAYKNFYEFLVKNGCSKTLNCLEWIKAIFELFERKTLWYLERQEMKGTARKYDKFTKQRVTVERKYTKFVWRQTSTLGETRKVLVNILGKFASYMKHKERGKLNRRAIASANMGLRMFLHVIERFHLELGRVIKGSTISIGGEEKKMKIISNFSETTLTSGPPSYVGQGTEDATKWNECLPPSLFALMHLYLFHDLTRSKLNLPKATEFGKLFSRIATAGNLLMACKTIQIGPGIMIKNEDYFRRIAWTDEEVKMLSEENQKWYGEVKEHITEDRRYLRASPGMLMGMLNAGSTTLGLLAVNHRMDSNIMRVVTLRSSDDSMSKYMSIDVNSSSACMERNRANLEMISINLSKDKTFFFPEGYGEYTSWYMDNQFVSQFGVETASIRPQAKNPPDDFYSIAKGTSVALSTLTMNPMGAEARLRLGIDGVRRLWRIVECSGKRPGVSDRVLLMADGGKCLWTPTNCHIQEIALKERECETNEEKEYLAKCLNPDNPFSEDPEEEMVYSKEHGCLILEEIETPRTVFHYVKRSNRTANTVLNQRRAEEERTYGEVIRTAKQVDPTLQIEYPNSNVNLSDHIMGTLMTMRNGIGLSGEEETLYKRAIDYLRTGEKFEASDESDIEEDDNF